MPTFHYLAKRGPTDTVEGEYEAETRAAVIRYLTGQGYTPVSVQETPATSTGMASTVAAGRSRPLRMLKVPPRVLNQFTRQCASLIRSQVAILRALEILRQQTPSPPLQQVLTALANDIRQGQTLSEALGQYPQIFSPLYVGLVRTGEAAGTLDTVFDRLAKQADQEEALRAKIRGALVYPLFVGVVGLGTVVFLLTFVLPKLLRLFEGFGGQLPLPTKILVATSQVMTTLWFWAAVAFAVIIVGLVVRTQQARLKALADRVSLRLPVLGPLLHQVELARFARTFGVLLDHGVPILQATEIAIPVVRHAMIRQQLERLPPHLKQGGRIGECLTGMPAMTPFVVNTVSVGEETGKVGEALLEVAEFYDREIDRSLQVLAALLEPFMILVVGAVVGFIVMAVLLPVFEISSVIR